MKFDPIPDHPISQGLSNLYKFQGKIKVVTVNTIKFKHLFGKIVTITALSTAFVYRAYINICEGSKDR